MTPKSECRTEEIACPGGEEAVPRRAPTLLIVEDESATRLGIETVFARAGWRVRSTSSAWSACRLIALMAFDAVILDHRLGPEELNGGLSVLEHLRGICPKTRVLFVTGCGDRVLKHSVLDAGAECYLEKPVSPKALLALLSSPSGKSDGQAGS